MVPLLHCARCPPPFIVLAVRPLSLRSLSSGGWGFGARAFGVGVGVCAGCCAAGVTVMGRDMIVPPHTVWCCPPVVLRAREWGVLVALTRARAEREGGRGGAWWPGRWWPGLGLWAVVVVVAYRVGE